MKKNGEAGPEDPRTGRSWCSAFIKGPLHIANHRPIWREDDQALAGSMKSLSLIHPSVDRVFFMLRVYKNDHFTNLPRNWGYEPG